MSDQGDDDLPETGPAGPGDADTIKMFVGDITSPEASLNGTSLQRPDTVAIARLLADVIHEGRGEAVLVGRLLADLGLLVDELANEHGATYIEDVRFENMVDLRFVSRTPPAETLDQPDSPGHRAAERFSELLRATSPYELLRMLDRFDEDAVRAFERLIKLLSEAGVTMDWQHRYGEPPVRMRRERAAQYFSVLQQEDAAPPDVTYFTGDLVGASIDRLDFRIHLMETWRRREQIEGHYDESLRQQMLSLLGQRVYATVTVLEERKGARRPELRFRLDDITALSSLT